MGNLRPHREMACADLHAKVEAELGVLSGLLCLCYVSSDISVPAVVGMLELYCLPSYARPPPFPFLE